MIDETLIELYQDLCCVCGIDPDEEFAQIVKQEHPELTDKDVGEILEKIRDLSFKKKVF